MKRYILLLLTSPLWASDDRYWQCTTSDGEKHWVESSIYERAAQGKAMDFCKKQSQAPSLCKIDCEEFNHGVSTRLSWQCTALDQNAKPWASQAHAEKDDAAIDAKKRCEEFSSAPDSCYLNLFTCKNLNHWP